jgi:hypothetical protein
VCDPSTYDLVFATTENLLPDFNGETPSRMSIFTHHFLSILTLFMILGLGIETAVKYPEGTIAPVFFLLSIILTLIFCVYFGRNKINLGDKRRV